MTLDSDRKERHENGHPATRSLPITAVPGPAQPMLQALCRTVAELAAATAEPPTRIKLQQGDTTVEVEWPQPVPPAAAGPPDRPVSLRQDGPAPGGGPEQDEAHYICAPSVGTFYRAAAPEAPPFVSVGDLVSQGQPVGVLEVMKMMSTIESDTAGRVVEIMAADGGPVEFRQRLIAVEPAPAEGR